ncbi:MAG: hypothetical protein ABIO76_08880 [Ginsengibacter sp.]
MLKAPLQLSIFLLYSNILQAQNKSAKKSGNPVFRGWYADLEGDIFKNNFWVYPTYSAPYDKQAFFDAFSSPDLVTGQSIVASSILLKLSRRTVPCGLRLLLRKKAEGGWTGPDYSVACAIGDSPFGPFERIDKVLQQNPFIATGTGHHSVIQIPETDKNGFIKPVAITREGVEAYRTKK